MHRFYISPPEWNSSALILRGAEAHHARDVLRLHAGASVVVFNGQGAEITAEISKLERGRIELHKVRETHTPPLACQIRLAQAIPKGKTMDLIVQKAVELGASEVVPLISDHTIVQLDASEAAHKQKKWQQIATEAAKQCGQNWLTMVRPPQKSRDFFSQLERQKSCRGAEDDMHSSRSLPPLRLIGSLQSGARHLKEVLGEYEREHGHPKDVLICIGPEGDFTKAELDLAHQHGCTPLTLGRIILRVETAAIYCLSVLSYELLT